MWLRIPLALVLLFVGCSSAEDIVGPFAEDSLLPTGMPEDVGLVPTYLEAASRQIAGDDDHELHSMLVVRNGLLVFEEYYNGYGRGNPHDLRSATKSITSLLTGIAIERGAVAGVDAPLMDYLRADYPGIRDKDDILFRHLLTMQGGLDCDDGDRSTRGQEDRMYRAGDWVEYFLSLSRSYAPGDTTLYCTGGVVALGEAIAQGAEQDFATFADDVLFSPLGVQNYQWARFDDGRKVDAGGHLFLTPQAMAKVGMLVLQGGEWDGRHVVSEEWIERSTQPRTEIGSMPYGYLWWSYTAQREEKAVDIVFASGNGGQMIFVVPEYDLVAVFTAGYYNSDRARIVFDLFHNTVLRSVSEPQGRLQERL
ncbi:serine hydrolase domain-containing protein [Rubrivirga sp.]|uniref:serine hydrolase domain-containing protein n=1 Tax=Rubrivirga sp. TaxID=1885344 RepID=UPI003C74B98D